ncbi:hypothetical protein ACQ4LE_010467, partial [Meloidogyne hapla]
MPVVLLTSDLSGNKVGLGKHILRDNKIVQLNGTMIIAKKEVDLDGYREVQDSCDVEITGNEDIIIWYRNDNVKINGCSIDLVTKNEGSIPLSFGVQNDSDLSKCLVDIRVTEGKGGMERPDATNYNTIPFSFSLKDDEFKNLKSSPQLGKNSDCGSKVVCGNRGGNCLKHADYSIGFAVKSGKVFYAVQPIGEPLYWYCSHKDNPNLPKSFLEIKIRNAGFDLISQNCEGEMDYNNKNIEPFCFKKEFIRKPEEWEITDTKYKETIFRYLFTFHMLPLKAAPVRFLSSTIWKEKLNEAKCDIFIRLDKKHVRMLTPSKNVNEMKTSTSISLITNNLLETKISIAPKIFKGTTNTSEGTNIFFIIGIILIVLIIVGLITVFLVWLFIIRSKNGEEGENGKTFSETKIDKWARNNGTTNIAF